MRQFKLRLESLEVETFEPLSFGDTSLAAKAYETVDCGGETVGCEGPVTFDPVIECMGRTIGGNWEGAC